MQSITASISESITFDPSTAPTISGLLAGTFTAAAGDLLLAHATDPFQSMGDSVYPGSFAPSGTYKLKLLYIVNNDASNTVTISRGTTNGLPVFNAADDALTLSTDGGFFLWYSKTGTAVLTTGSNDKLTVAVSGGTPSCELLAIYGT